MEMAGKLVEKGGVIGNELQQRTAKAAKKWTEILNTSLRQFRPLLSRFFFSKSSSITA